MPYELRQYPPDLPEKEADALASGQGDIDAALQALKDHGPKDHGYALKVLGKSKGGLWQMNLKISKANRQIRILYKPYGNKIVVFHVHKKSSQAEQQRAYDTALRRLKAYENAINQGAVANDGPFTIH